MKKTILCILGGLLMVVSTSLNAEPAPYMPLSPSPSRRAITERIPIIITPTESTTETPASITTTPTSLTCDGATIITIDADRVRPINPEVQRYLSDYARYEHDGAYKLCFNIQNKPRISVVAGLTFNNPSDKPVLISGLELKRDPTAPAITFPLLTINTTSPVVLIDSDIQGIGEGDEGTCLVLRGMGHTVRGSSFHDCDVAIQNEAMNSRLETNEIYNSGIGVKAVGNNATIVGSTIRNNDVGVKIEGSNNFLGASSEATFDAEKNEIFNNRTAGIFWSSGTGNRFPFNVITNSSQHSILIENALGIIEPSLTVTKADVGGVLKCEKDPATGRTTRSVHFENTPEGIYAVLHKSNTLKEVPEMPDYSGKCRIDARGNCNLDTISSLTFSGTECKTDDNIWITAVVDSNLPAFTTALTKPGLLVGGPTLIATPAPIDIASSSPVAAGPPPDDSDTGGSQMTGSAVKSSGPGGCGGGASIVPPSSFDPSTSLRTGKLRMNGSESRGSGRTAMSTWLILWWLIFAAPAVLVAVRIKKRR